MSNRDHRSLGSRLDLYHIEEDAPGMVFWHPRGFAVYRVLEDYIRSQMRSLGYAEVRTPQLMPRDFWRRSGHWDRFGAHMFSVGADDHRPMALKPMSCPCHVQVFNRTLRSWRDLPLRYAEFGACHRDEPSGAMHGLLRTRAFEQDDAHVFCREQDVQQEVARFIGLLSRVYAELGFARFDVALSTRPDVRAGANALWDWAEAQLSEAARSAGLSFFAQPGEGAFYGPKLEFILRDQLGRAWQCGTIQLDAVLPERLDASYVSPDGTRVRPVMIHHAVFGSMGRLIAILLEHHNGALPVWLAPEQVAVLPITRAHHDFADDLADAFTDAGLRVAVLADNETLGRRILAAHQVEIPVIAIVGPREMEERAVTLRERDGSQVFVPFSDAVAALAERGRAPRPTNRAGVRVRAARIPIPPHGEAC